jgi:hypothetical protein
VSGAASIAGNYDGIGKCRETHLWILQRGDSSWISEVERVEIRELASFH